MRTGLVHMDLAKQAEQATAELALATLLEFGLKWAKGLEGRPARVEVRDASLRNALAGPLATLDTTVALVEDMPAVREVLHNLEAHSTGERLPVCWNPPVYLSIASAGSRVRPQRSSSRGPGTI
jgi:hypothetical protein